MGLELDLSLRGGVLGIGEGEYLREMWRSIGLDRPGLYRKPDAVHPSG